jgi:uncharacterized protein (DUF433 family)
VSRFTSPPNTTARWIGVSLELHPTDAELTMVATSYAHIDLRNDVPYITGTRMKVVLLAAEHRGLNADAVQLRDAHPQLTLAQIHSALAYYYDHKDEMDEAIEQRERLADSIQVDVESERAGTAIGQKLQSLAGP